ncbi:azurin [Variovorax sp. GB1P17]|uniref:azurin n=1 Tax=Variovorax sp. GB1P17 TaxID=3443740 RepID=UPI003F44DDC5
MRKLFALALMLAAASTHAATCETTVSSNDQMQFDTKSISVPKSCKTFKVTLKHSGKLAKTVMGHNLVIVSAAAIQGVATDGMAAGAANGYIKPNDERVVAATALIGGGETTSTEFDVSKLKAGVDYGFICSFPGHSSLMKGAVVLVN